MARMSDLPLNELYAKIKITSSVEMAIQSKEDFSKISNDYCSKVCRLKCKSNGVVRLLDQEVDILIISDHRIPKGKYDKTDNGSDIIQNNIIELICQKAGFQGLTYRLTHLLKCKPSEQDFPLGKSPTATVLSKCKPYLLEEIKSCKPKVIISLSTAVTKVIGFPKHSNTHNRGEVLSGKDYNVVVSLNPKILSQIRQNAVGSSGFWSADYFEVIRRDFEKASNLVRGTLLVPNLLHAIKIACERNIVKCKSIDDVAHYINEINYLPENSLVSFDIETNSLDCWAEDSKILMIQFGYKISAGVIRSVVIPLWHRKNTFINPASAWNLLAPILLGPIKKIGWNVKFDMTFIYAVTGIKVQNVVLDGLLLLHALDSGAQGTFSLKTAVTDFLLESGLSGYEDLLPKLTKPKKDGVSEEPEDDENDD